MLDWQQAPRLIQMLQLFRKNEKIDQKCYKNEKRCYRNEKATFQ